MSRIAIALVLLCACKGEPAAPPAPGSASGSAAVDPWNAERAPRPPPSASDPFPHPMLWSATKDGKVMHLFGTLHQGVDVTRRLPRWVWKKFDAATVLVQEVDLHGFATSVWASPPMESRSLRAALGEQRWSRVVAAVSPAALVVIDHAPTFTAYLQVSSIGARATDVDAIPMDADLLVRAKEQHKALVFLESIETHGTLLQSLYGMAELETLIDHIDELPAINGPYFDRYVDGDGEKFYELALASMRVGAPDEATLAKHVDRLLLARNRAWIEPLEAAHAKHPSEAVFVTVGVLHLLGPNNVLALLEQRGFTIAREQP